MAPGIIWRREIVQPGEKQAASLPTNRFIKTARERLLENKRLDSPNSKLNLIGSNAFKIIKYI